MACKQNMAPAISSSQRQMRRDVLEEPWHGVSLGGWLILEPGPSYPLFDKHLDTKGERLRCEWDLMKRLRKYGMKRAESIIIQHRETHITKDDFVRIKNSGLNAVRVPFGYWCVLSPSADDIYVGSGLEYIDRAVQWAEECGLQVVLDLHGCPGGESGEAPCGRRQRPDGTWKWRDWRFSESLKALKVLVQRYKTRRCVTGIAVCNEPSNEVPLTTLCRYYDKAVDVVRLGGMPAEQVSVVLPDFQRPEGQVAQKFHEISHGRHANFCFDVHCYHCFENNFNGKSFAQQLRATEANAEMLRKYPMVVGEWSLALGAAAWQTCADVTEDDAYKLLGTAQAQAYQAASHGSFFWNWTEQPDNLEWNFQMAHHKNLLSGPPLVLPQWNGCNEDPLENIVNRSPVDPFIALDDPVYVRVFHGRYVDVVGSTAMARWPDKGEWQELTFCAPANCTGKPTQAVSRRRLQSGDLVRVRATNGRFLAADSEGNVSAVSSRAARQKSAEFVLHIESADGLRHRGAFWLETCFGTFLDADEDEDGIYARYSDQGSWQMFNVDKAPHAPGGQLSAQPCVASALRPPPQAAAKLAMIPQGTPTKTPQKRKNSMRLESAQSKEKAPQKRRRAASVVDGSAAKYNEPAWQ